MIEKSKEHMFILLPYAVIVLLVLGSVLVEFKVIDIMYLFALTFFLIKYLLLKSKRI